MYGAILGDIIGSPYEFDRGEKTKVFDLFIDESSFTDDTVMTIAVAEALIKLGKNAKSHEIEKEIIFSMQNWGRKYPNESYGLSFAEWLREKDPKPYNSFGNGSAMRVSSVGWLYDSLEKTREVARATAGVTHNHPEGIKGAESIASAIYLARNGATKAEIKIYVESEFGYDLSRTLEDIRPTYYMYEICQKTVPEAITCFLEAEDFEDCIRNAVSIGGDVDTIGAIACSIAEAFFGIPKILIDECNRRIPNEMKVVLDNFYNYLNREI
ncbi:ADP-ribosylglycohydrolase [Peptoniphilus asaccharolyticus DSM 20463]|uniref:ADP-ribosylglycohydrolase n=1 Tax=Peptoniphilus asaccharolyticus DSM 20463 TaxID=573058 RepID=A0A1W1UG74_PEPAS|nr:ADP-ribosylglycohydrolase family protein [Peptoniphilus asaccharolyticus]MBL7574680.1 ADP-ribosylglycohydrolase family protein [Peptoniphilus asaccharolyticus]SMB80086.1 ADP-ribosylglycohydrolase [Peptoniphilus asaccharolyticus DSM 20463]